jgi:hypothetical protein
MGVEEGECRLTATCGTSKFYSMIRMLGYCARGGDGVLKLNLNRINDKDKKKTP